MSSISTQNASSLLSFSSSTPQWKYDVFLSFRGEDTYNSFTNHLYVALKQKGIFIFRDEEKIKRGKSISPKFLKAIEESRSVIVCVVFCSHPHHQIPNGDSLSCWLVANGKKMSSAPNTGHIVVLSDHIWLLYLLPQYYQEKQIKLLWECDANGFIRVGIRIMTHCAVFEVKRCGFNMVYKKDIEDVNRSMAQCSNNSTIPYKGLDFLHHKFGNAKRTCDDYRSEEHTSELQSPC